jgi:hypothetical protein
MLHLVGYFHWTPLCPLHVLADFLPLTKKQRKLNTKKTGKNRNRTSQIHSAYAETILLVENNHTALLSIFL